MSGPTAELLDFLSHSLALEGEAEERYGELAEAMAVHNNPQVAAFFRRMAEEAGRHRAEVEQLAGGAELPQLAAWEFRWPGAEAPESASYEALHYRMTLAEAMTLALQNEEEAGAFYRAVAESSGDPATVATARTFAEEESQHAAALQRMLAELPPAPQHAREDDDQPHLPE